LLMLRTGTNRADLGRVVMSFWVPILIFSTINLSTPKPFYRVRKSLIITGLVIFVLTLLFFFKDSPVIFLPYVITPYIFLTIPMILQANLEIAVDGYILTTRIFYRWFSVLMSTLIIIYGFLGFSKNLNNFVQFLTSISNPPPNATLVSPDLIDASERLKQSDTHCIFDLSNHGMFNTILQLPPCTRYSYPVYASSDYESSMLNELEQSSPASIIYSSENWSYSIDGKPMPIRFPELDMWIKKNYPVEECNDSYCIRLKSESK